MNLPPLSLTSFENSLILFPGSLPSSCVLILRFCLFSLFYQATEIFFYNEDNNILVGLPVDTRKGIWKLSSMAFQSDELLHFLQECCL